MPDAPAQAKPAPTETPVLRVDEDPRFARWPTVRHSMILLIPIPSGGTAKIALTETKSGGRLEITEAGSAFEKAVNLNCLELRQLSDFCNRIARRVALRPEHRP